jgi:hypothetical protein
MCEDKTYNGQKNYYTWCVWNRLNSNKGEYAKWNERVKKLVGLAKLREITDPKRFDEGKAHIIGCIASEMLAEYQAAAWERLAENGSTDAIGGGVILDILNECLAIEVDWYDMAEKVVLEILEDE